MPCPFTGRLMQYRASAICLVRVSESLRPCVCVCGMGSDMYTIYVAYFCPGKLEEERGSQSRTSRRFRMQGLTWPHARLQTHKENKLDPHIEL